MPEFKGDFQDPVGWLEDFDHVASANNYDNDYKFQVIGGFLKGSAASWFTEASTAGVNNQIVRWAPANAGENPTSFTTRFIQKF